ncbi:MAG: hypothetical protein Q4E60_11020 [Bacteroidales bacterium]|nr:hypothetical protein [Bacteroidales bacterium]
MKQRILPLLFGLLAACALVGCTRSLSTKWKNQVVALAYHYPDSALQMLRTVNKNDLAEADKAFYCLLYTLAQDKSGLNVNRDSLLRYAYLYYQNHPQDSMYARCMYYTGLYYYLNDSTKQAEDLFRISNSAAQQTGDYYTAYLALNRLADALSGSNPPLALLAAKQSYDVYTQHCNDNPINKGYLLTEIGYCFMQNAQHDSAIFYQRKALLLATEVNNTVLMAGVQQSLANTYRNAQKPDSSLYFAKQAWSLRPKPTESLTITLADAYLVNDSLDQCCALLQNLHPNNDYRNYSRYVTLAQCWYKKGNIQLYKQYNDSAKEADYVIYLQALQDRTDYLLDKVEMEKQLQQEYSQSKLHRVILYAVIVTLLLFVVFFAFMYHNKSVRRKIEFEKHQLTLQHYEQQVRLMKKYVLSKLNLDSEILEIKKNQVKIDISEDLWNEIELSLNANDLFVARLREQYPSLSLEDLRFCMLLRLDFNTDELSRVYGIAPVSVKQKQVKFESKFGENTVKTSLRTFIQTF